MSVVTLYAPDLSRFLASKVPDPAEAQDLVQEVYLRMLKVERPGLIRSPKAYLFRVAINIVHEHWLKRAARPAHVTFDEAFDESLSVEIDAFTAQSPEGAAVTAERVAHLSQLLAPLSPKVRAALIWAHRDGHTYDEISARLAVSRNRVKKYLAKALAHCRSQALATANS